MLGPYKIIAADFVSSPPCPVCEEDLSPMGMEGAWTCTNSECPERGEEMHFALCKSVSSLPDSPAEEPLAEEDGKTE